VFSSVQSRGDGSSAIGDRRRRGERGRREEASRHVAICRTHHPQRSAYTGSQCAQ